MLRILVLALLLVATPVLAGDDFLKQIFDGDGPSITDGQPTGEQANNNGGAATDDQQAALDAAFDAAQAADPVVEDDCPPERYGTCPELLSPEDRAAYDATMASGGPHISVSPFVKDDSTTEEPPPDDEPVTEPSQEPDPVPDDSASDPSEDEPAS